MKTACGTLTSESEKDLISRKKLSSPFDDPRTFISTQNLKKSKWPPEFTTPEYRIPKIRSWDWEWQRRTFLKILGGHRHALILTRLLDLCYVLADFRWHPDWNGDEWLHLWGYHDVLRWSEGRWLHDYCPRWQTPPTSDVPKTDGNASTNK